MRRALLASALACACATTQAERGDDRVDDDRPAERAAKQGGAASSKAPLDAVDDRPAAARSGNVQGAALAAAQAAQQMAMQMQQANAQAAADCSPLINRPVAWPEERAIGAASALALIRTGKGLYLDPLPEKTAAGAQAKRDASGAAGVALPPGEKNDVTSYVQRVGALVASRSARPSIAWTFAVLDDPTPRVSSTLGGYVFITTGALAKLENEAQLAAVLAHEVAHVAGPDWRERYAKARVSMCKTALTGLSLVMNGASNVPGSEQFVANAKFGKTLKKLADPEGLDVEHDPDVDPEFLRWYAGQALQFQQMLGFGADEEARADAEAAVMLGTAGYDPAALEQALGLFEAARNAGRISALTTLRDSGEFGLTGGKSPAFPTHVHLPR